MPFACMPRSIHMLPPTLGASSAHTSFNISQSGSIRSVCAEDYESLQPYWDPTPDLSRASNQAPFIVRPSSREQGSLWSPMTPQSGDFLDCGIELRPR